MYLRVCYVMGLHNSFTLLSAGHESFMVINIYVVVFWVMITCSDVVGYQRF